MGVPVVGNHTSFKFCTRYSPSLSSSDFQFFSINSNQSLFTNNFNGHQALLQPTHPQSSVPRRILLLSILLVCVIFVVSLYRVQSLFDFAPIITYFDCISDFHSVTFHPASKPLPNVRKTLTWPSLWSSTSLVTDCSTSKQESLYAGEGLLMYIATMK